jgi:spore germination protein KB
MLEHGRISKQQLTWLYANGLLGASLLYLPQVLTNEAKQDVWITVVLGAFVGIALLWLWTALARRFPSRNFVEYTQDVLGRPLGLIVLFIYLGYLMWIILAMLREIVDFFAINYPQTPEEFTTLCFVVLIAYMSLSGLEVIARVNDLVFPIIVLGIVILIVLTTPMLSLQSVQPIMAHGLKPVLTPLQVHASFPYGNAVGFLMLFPYLRQVKDLRRATFIGSLIGSAIIFAITVFLS